VFRPHIIDGCRLIDGALLNPVPVTPLIRDSADYLIAVSVDGPAVTVTPPEPPNHPAIGENGYRHRIGEFLGRLVPQGDSRQREPGTFELLLQSMDLMQANLSRLRLAAYAPDLLIQLPHNMALAYEFYRARELIEAGRMHAREAMANWPQADASQR